MRKKDFLAEVMNEIEIIKTKATPSEIGKLNIDSFNHTIFRLCIYGLMTGDCDSVRALDMYPKQYAAINGNDTKDYTPFTKQNMARGSFNGFTPLEKYLYMVKRPMHKKIISYLKGETQSIKLV